MAILLTIALVSPRTVLGEGTTYAQVCPGDFPEKRTDLTLAEMKAILVGSPELAEWVVDDMEVAVPTIDLTDPTEPFLMPGTVRNDDQVAKGLFAQLNRFVWAIDLNNDGIDEKIVSRMPCSNGVWACTMEVLETKGTPKLIAGGFGHCIVQRPHRTNGWNDLDFVRIAHSGYDGSTYTTTTEYQFDGAVYDVIRTYTRTLSWNTDR